LTPATPAKPKAIPSGVKLQRIPLDHVSAYEAAGWRSLGVEIDPTNPFEHVAVVVREVG